MFSTGYILAALTAFTAVVSAAATPADITAREENSGVIQLCQGVNFSPDCIKITFSTKCINFRGDTYGPFDNDVSSISIPSGYECTLYEEFDCHDASGNGEVTLDADYYPELYDTPNGNWNDRASSLLCQEA